MMLAEIFAGHFSGSMSLLADGWHMGTHAAALGVTVFAYRFARLHADNVRFSFGTGKVGALGGFASAVGLAVVALLIGAESVRRFFMPVGIHFNEAIAVAVLGLAVNLVSAWLLRGGQEEEDHGHLHHDHNLRAAYLHVMADALTSVLAIVALTTGKYLNAVWMDPVMGVAGSVIIAKWSIDLLRKTSAVLLDAEMEIDERKAVQNLIESDADNRVSDLHVWRVGPRHLAAILSVITRHPKEPSYYKKLLASRRDLVHVTVEVHSGL